MTPNGRKDAALGIVARGWIANPGSPDSRVLCMLASSAHILTRQEEDECVILPESRKLGVVLIEHPPTKTRLELSQDGSTRICRD
jgi:hypothetical protein